MEAILQAKEISKTYHTGSVDVPALKQCSLEFGKGEFTAIIGKSGSGKSTLLRILGSMDTPDTGNLDAGSAETVAKMLSKASQKYEQTIIMVTHDRQMADYADRIITISDGQIQ